MSPSATAIEPTDDDHKLQFGLTAFTLADNIEFDPERVAQGAFGLKATRLEEGLPPDPSLETAASVACMLQTPGKIVA